MASGLGNRLWRASTRTGRLAFERWAIFPARGRPDGQGVSPRPQGNPGKQGKPAGTAGRPAGKQGKQARPAQGKPRPKAYFTAPRSLAQAVVKAVRADPRGGVSYLMDEVERRAPGSLHRPVVPVPVPPQALDYTDMGTDVVAPRAYAFRQLPLSRERAEDGPATGLYARVSIQHVLHPWSMRYLEATTDGIEGAKAPEGHRVVAALAQFPHCLAERTRRRYAAKNSREPLWWFVLVHAGGPSGDRDPVRGVVQRTSMQRRVERAFREALRRRGYDEAGRPLPDAGRKLTLHGTVRIEGIIRPLLAAGFDRVAARLEDVVRAVEQRLYKEHKENNAKNGPADFGPERSVRNAGRPRTFRELDLS